MKYLKIKIIENGYTIRDIANKLNINEQTLSNWINSRNTNQIKKFLELLVLLNFNNEDLKKLI